MNNQRLILVFLFVKSDPACQAIDTKKHCYIMYPSCQNSDTSDSDEVNANLYRDLFISVVIIYTLFIILYWMYRRIKGMYNVTDVIKKYAPYLMVQKK